jgi:hypothetical protein
MAVSHPWQRMVEQASKVRTENNVGLLLLPLSPNKPVPKIHASQTILSLIYFIEKSNDIYDIKWVYYEKYILCFIQWYYFDVIIFDGFF